MGTTSLSVLSVILILSVIWKPAYSDKCSLACAGSPTTPGFLNGHTYNYGVEGVVSIYLTGAEKQETNVKIFGQVSVSALGNCAHSLKVNVLSISDPDGKKFPAPKGIDKPVQFSLQDGKVGAEICAEDGDTRRSLNIKRAIISLLQTEQKSGSQVDVFGACPTEVSSSQEGGAVLVHKTRDLSRCAHREQGKNDLLTAVYNPTAEIKNTQVLQSLLNVESKVNNGVPEKVSASEEYLYKPFSVGENGARAKVHTKLTLTGTAKGGANAGNCPESHTIIFENPHGVVMDQSNFDNAMSAIKDICKTLTHEASSKSAGAFAQVVRVFRTTNKDDLMKVFNQVKGDNLEKRVFLDAVLRAGTGYSVEVSIQILKSKVLSPLEEKLVFLSLGNARHVNDEALKAAATLLDQPNTPKEVYLGVGALAGTYCRDHNCHGSKPDGIVALSNKIAAKLQNCKPKTKPEEDYVVAALKGIRNIRHLEDSLIDKLVHCVQDNNVKARVKVAAFEALQADPCASKVKKVSLDVLKNRQLDSEIRINAYLTVIACPCAHSANEIKNLLETEPVHQVGRFIVSSLRYIRSSANPDKRLAKQHYGLIGTPMKFNIDDRKYSFYREFSYNVDALGAGGNVEQTVIYSQDSFLPRSGSLNLTAELFGHSINVLEVGGRQGNLDRVMEHFLGPKSFLRTQKPQDIYDDLVKRVQESTKKIESKVRGRRSIKSEIDHFDKQLKAESVSYHNELDLDVYLKLFGTEAVFLSLGDDKGFDFNTFLDQMLNIANDGMNKLKNFRQEVRGHLLFLDAELAYPTSTGLPLKLELNGAATARVELATSIDLRQILRSPENGKVDIKVIPSTDIEVAGVMMVDADSVATGLKVTTNLHSSTGAHIIAKIIENGQGFDLQLGLPLEKQEVLTASNDLVYFTAAKGCAEKTVPIKVDNNQKSYSGCFDQLSGMLGMTVCGELSIPFSVSGPEAQNSIAKFLARYPLTGSSKVKVELQKNDLHGYHIKGVVRRDSKQGHYGVEMLFDAEGQQNRRTQVTGEIINNVEEKSLRLALESPIKVLTGQVAFYNKPSEFALLLRGKMDQAEYYARAGFNVQGGGKRRVYKPVLEYELPDVKGKQSLKTDGQLIEEVDGPVRKYTLEGVKINLPNSNEPVCIDGHFNSEPKNIEVDLKAKKGQYNMLLSGSLKGADCKIEFQNTLNPYVNFKMNGHFENGDGVAHNDIDLYYGSDLRDQRSRVTFNQLYKSYKKSAQDFNFITKNKFQIHALPLKVKVDAEVDPKKLDIELEGEYMDRKAEFDLEARTHIKKAGDYSGKLSICVDKQDIEMFAKRDIVSADKSNLENYIQIKNFGRYELSGVVLHRTKPNDMNVGAMGHFKISGGGKNQDIKFDVGVIENSNLYSSHAKVSSSKDEQILDFLLKVTRGANPNGQLKFILKDSVAANGQFKVTDNDGKGNGMVLVDFKKAGRKIKADVQFVVKEPVYNIEGDIFLNFEKDNNDKIHVSTNNRISEKFIDSKNKLVYAGKKTEVNVHQDGIRLYKGVSSLEVVLPTERCLNLKVNRDLNVKDNTYDGTAELKFTDSPKRGAAGSSITYNTKITNTNFEKEVIDLEGQWELKLNNGKDLVNTFSYKNTPKGQKSDVSFDNRLTGSLMPNPAALTASATYTDLPHMDNTYRVKGTYGSDIAVELVGNFEAQLLDKGEKRYIDDFTMTFLLPFEKAHDIKWVSTLIVLKPESKDTEVTLIESVQVNADLYKVDSSGRYGEKSGTTKIKLLAPHVEPVVFDVTYNGDLEGEKKTGSMEMKAQYGKGKTVTVAASGGVAPNEYQLKFTANAPQAEKLKRLDIDYLTKTPSPDTYNTVLVIDVDGKVYREDFLVVYSRSQPMLDFKYTSPSSEKPSRIYAKGNTMSTSEGKFELKVENFRNVDIDASGEAKIEKDNVVLKMKADADCLKLKNFEVDVSSKDASNGKRLEFRAVNDNKNLLSGSTSFISKQEGPKTIVEGSGSIKVKDDQKPANFKYIRTVLHEGNEQGIETFMNVAIGERSYISEGRITNLEYKTSFVYCEEKKQCANAEMHSKINVQKPGVVQHQVYVGFDLRKLGFAPEFGLQMTNEFSDKKLPQYELDMHVNKEEKKYHLHVYSQPTEGKFPAGVTVTLPHRVLALESLVQYPTDKGMPFPIRGEVCMYPDKNKPNLKTAARFNVDFTGSEQQHTAVAELGFSHPKLGKEALIKFHGTAQRPGENTLKVETKASVSHSIFGNEREAKMLLEVNPSHVKLYMDTPIVKVIDLEGSSILKENLQQGDLKFSLLQGKPVQVRAVVKDFQYYEFTTGYSDESERKLSVIGHLEPEKRVDVSVDIILPGTKKNIIHGALFLQDNLVKTDYGVSQDNFNYFVHALKNDVNTLGQRVKDLGEKANNEFKKVAKKAEKVAKDMEQAYAEDLQKLIQEITNDKTLKEISESLHNIVQFLAKMIDEVVQVSKPIVDKIVETVRDLGQKIIEMYEKRLEPQIKELYSNIAAMIKEYMDGVIDTVAHFVAIVVDFFEKHKPELEELTNTLAEIFKDLTRIVVAQLKEIRAKVSQVFAELYQQIKDMPIIALIKEKYQELAIPEQALGMLHDLHNAVRVFLPTEELKNLADVLYDYVSKKIRQEKVDEAKELRFIYTKLVSAVTSLVKFIQTQLNEVGVSTIPSFNFLPIGGPGPLSAPALGGSASVSVINQLLRGDVPDPIALLRAYRPRSINLLDEIPAKLRAVVVNGQHIFTFDGRHLTFPGNCRYVLAHDHVDRNFTLLMQMQNGQPKSLILEDKSGVTIELKENGQAALNGAAHGYPVIEKDVFAFRQPNGRIGLGSLYGLMVFCTSKLEVCYVDVSGFYLGKLRGLLGDGNNEPYDDFRMPNGKITNSESDFGNSYKLAASCPAVKTPEHSHHQHHQTLPAACETVFGGISPLRPLSLLLDVAPFRQACIHAVTDDSPKSLQQACDLGRGYAALALTGLLPAVLPTQCVSCTDADKPREVGEMYEMKLPGKQADIVVTVDTTKANAQTYKDLVVPLVSQVVDQMKSKRITDIKVYLVGATSKYPYPILYDTDLKLKTAKIEFDDESRYEKLPSVNFNNEKVNNFESSLIGLIDMLRIKLGVYNVMATYQSILDLPLRPGAVKHYLAVVGEACPSQAFFLGTFRALMYSQIMQNNAITSSLVTLTPDLKVGGKCVVGFSKNSVLLLGDKKLGKDAETQRSTLQVPQDACIDFMQELNGFVFSATNFRDLNPAQQKQFLQTAATSIANRLLQESLVQECTCTYVDPFRVRSVCVNKERREGARRRK